MILFYFFKHIFNAILSLFERFIQQLYYFFFSSIFLFFIALKSVLIYFKRIIINYNINLLIIILKRTILDETTNLCKHHSFVECAIIQIIFQLHRVDIKS
jgi:hypothetical protein